ncbi:TetR family transcriptional regulator C-terminal domain-containing protein [Curtobacterium sp. MCSS17_015]|uniref:TetR/AcrR family transcriptional regulator n=1 Tax=Curtobacterium sp. MCSS17_015 TaxID=2175666 RepID=UPI0015E897DD|nr:TetR family transcriptional regulator C-terminal domain-containing protein [Curtobacterium sp. MCSS17_015]WIB27982.1 TetR family transcriptional regulator C-terminal domain-containing protein [Curtobacterium sp. MCSS17_015]
MPRLIDHSERDAVIAAAAWRVLSRDGLPGFSVRRVAEEAGLATASLRRAFPTQVALRSYCLRLVGERVQARMDAVAEATDRDADPRAFVLACLAELLPLDTGRRTEMEVWLTLGSLALTDADARAAHDDSTRTLARACRSLLALLRPDADPGELDTAARRLHALVDGLALHLVHAAPTEDTTWALDALDAAVPAAAGTRVP